MGSGALALASCTALNPGILPTPGNSYRDGYEVVFEFESALNLPDRAKVVMDGAPVGIVTRVALAGDHVDVVSRISREVRIPENAHASLQQATVLGDIYVSVAGLQADGSAAYIPISNGRISMLHTVSPPEVEDTIATLATFVSGGSIQRIQDTVIGLNRITPQGDEARAIASRVAADLADLSTGIETVDEWLAGLSGTTEVLNSRIPDFKEMFSDHGLRGFDRVSIASGYTGRLFPSLGSVYSNGFWLVPLLDTLGEAFGAMQRDKQAFEAEVPAWKRLFYEDFLPQDKYPAMNIVSIVGPEGQELSGDVQGVLRMIGAAP
ncbi:mammalian cell entry protein [Mycolicibacter kumamotonensis]|uniref:Mammalian cell entry protein n=2 Tax=Mycolicibacter kumamotonensis TaxID=354243 RepID=A0A1B8S9Y8_9MYCO|nr:mammalian cell entry protein [Mycolicibacter kumamotonensis]